MRKILVLTVLLYTTGAYSIDTMSCGTHLVMPGDTKAEVLQRCGQPLSVEIISGALEPAVEQWYYQPSRMQFARVLTFQGFILKRIDTLTKPLP
jgi:hypothetical protein